MKFKLIFFFITTTLFSQESNFTSENISINEYIDGTLLNPKEIQTPNLIIIIAGSGPTDRDGNQNFAKNNSLKKLAESLSKNNIATFRYDKRSVKQIKTRKINDDLRFDDFIEDAKSVVKHFKNTNTYNKIFIAGHSQGSLIGMIAAQEDVDGFISIAGPGHSINITITEQINASAPQFTEDCKRIFNILKEGKTTNDYPQALASIFNVGVQPFIANWMQYNPQEEIKTLNIPILIINGSKDLQVFEADANVLKTAAPDAKLTIIKDMNHILTPINSNDTLENRKSYNEPLRPIAPELIRTILAFIK